MRLLPLREHSEKVDRFLKMWADFLIEQEPNITKKQSTKVLIAHLRRELDERLFDKHNEPFLIEYDKQVIGISLSRLEEKCFPDEDLPEMCLHIDLFYV